ncbi:type VI secretion system baseplate subunit TssF [Edwardsiella anguillarum]|nr:type VI secretion system baseplate subunit TssF [Edwardsiella anguillarum]
MLPPLFGLHHANDSEPQRVFWMENRRGGLHGDDPGQDVYLSLVDLDFDPNQSSTETLSIDVTCTNREFPSLLPFGGVQGTSRWTVALPSPGSTACASRRPPCVRPTAGPPCGG